MAAAETRSVGSSDDQPGAIVSESNAVGATQRAQVRDIQARVPYHGVIGAISGGKRQAGDLPKVLRCGVKVYGVCLGGRSTQGTEILHDATFPEEGIGRGLTRIGLPNDLSRVIDRLRETEVAAQRTKIFYTQWLCSQEGVIEIAGCHAPSHHAALVVDSERVADTAPGERSEVNRSVTNL